MEIANAVSSARERDSRHSEKSEGEAQTMQTEQNAGASEGTVANGDGVTVAVWEMEQQGERQSYRVFL
jgi:hypothetical protein